MALEEETLDCILNPHRVMNWFLIQTSQRW
jgi:hypothetical protein